MATQPPPPPPPPPPTTDRLSSIRTYILIAFIFAIIMMIAWVLSAISLIIGYIAIAATLGELGQYYAGFYAAGLVEGIIFLVWFVLAILVFFRVWKMYKAVNAGDIATLKATSSMMWAIIALIFTIIPGIMLIIADGPIKQL